MTPARRVRLQGAFDHVVTRKREGMDAGTIISELIGQHQGVFRSTGQTNKLQVAGVSSTCSWSKDAGLLDGWTRLAASKLMEPAEGYGHE